MVCRVMITVFTHVVHKSVRTSVLTFKIAQNKTIFKWKQRSLLARLWVWPRRSFMTPIMYRTIFKQRYFPTCFLLLLTWSWSDMRGKNFTKFSPSEKQNHFDEVHFQFTLFSAIKLNTSKTGCLIKSIFRRGENTTWH